MQKPWNEWRAIERYLLGTAAPEERQAFRARLYADPAWSERVAEQRLIYRAIRWLGRRRLRQEIQAVRRRLFAGRPASPLARQARALFPDDKRRD